MLWIWRTLIKNDRSLSSSLFFTIINNNKHNLTFHCVNLFPRCFVTKKKKNLIGRNENRIVPNIPITYMGRHFEKDMLKFIINWLFAAYLDVGHFNHQPINYNMILKRRRWNSKFLPVQKINLSAPIQAGPEYALTLS